MADQDNTTNSNDGGWLDKPGSTDVLYRLLLVACAILLLADVLDMLGIGYHKHVHYSIENVGGFYGIFGFSAYSLIVGAGWIWRRVVMRDEDYYDA
jgi:hypothetical protein